MNHRTLAIRFTIYGLMMLYIVADLYWFQGPLHRTVETLKPGSAAEMEKTREANVAAIVFGEGITLAQLDMRVLRHLRKKGLDMSSCSPDRLYQLRLILLQELMLERIVEGKLRLRHEDHVDQALVDAEIAAVKNQFSSPAQAAKAITAAGLGGTRLSAVYREWMNQRNYVERIVAGNADRMPIEDHIEAYYHDHEGSFVLPERYHVRHLFLATLGKDPGEVEEKIAEIHLKIASGQTSFVEMVAENSEDPASKDIGGDLGWLSGDRLPGAIPVEVIAALAPAEMSAPVQSRIGWHLFDLIEKRPARKLALEEVREIIRKHLAHQQRVRYADALKRVMEYDAEARVVFESLILPYSFPEWATPTEEAEPQS